MRPKKKARPQDYPQIAFRIDDANKARIMTLIDEVTEIYNSHVKEDECKFRKNDIIMEALEKGLAILKKRYEE